MFKVRCESGFRLGNVECPELFGGKRAREAANNRANGLGK